MDFIICNRYTAAHVVSLVSLNIIKWHYGNCSKCRHRVTYSEASQIVLEQTPFIKLICLECITNKFKAGEEIQLATIPKHLIELEKIRLAKERGKN